MLTSLSYVNNSNKGQFAFLSIICFYTLLDTVLSQVSISVITSVIDLRHSQTSVE